MNIVLVNPIATTPSLTTGSLLRPGYAHVPTDPTVLGEINIVELGVALARFGHSTSVVLAGSGNDRKAICLSQQMTVVPVDAFLRIPFHPRLLPLTPGLIRNPVLEEADVIQAGEFHQPSTFFASMVSRERGIPLVVWQETFCPMKAPGSWYQRAYELTVGKRVRSAASRCVPRTTKARTYLERLRIPQRSIGPWIPTGVDVSRFAPKKSRLSPEDFGWAGDARILLMVARLHRSKGIDFAMQVVKNVQRWIPEVRLLIRGSGPELGNLQRLATNLGIQDSVRILGGISRDQMIQLYNLSSAVLSTSRADLLPFALIEASACGRPCVAADVGAVTDIVVDKETGLILRGYRLEEWGQAIRSLLRDDDTAQTLGQNARRRTETAFNLQRIAGSLVELYRGIAA